MGISSVDMRDIERPSNL